MRAGQLNRRIQIVQPTAIQDASGQPSPGDDVDVLDCAAAISVISGKEIYALGPGFTAQVSHMVRIRFPAVDVAASMKVIYGARTFLVQFVLDPDEDRRQLSLVCLQESK